MLNSYPWYISDWRDSETRLAMSAAARGIYRELLDYCWLEGSLPTDSDTLVKLSAVTKREFTVHWPRIKQCFKEVDGRLHNTKVDEKRPFVLQAKEDRQRGAERANEIIRARRLANAERNAERTLSSDAQCTPPSSPSPSTTTTTPPSTVLDAECAAFEIWEAFPADRQGALQTVEHALTDLIGPLNEPERSNRLRRILGNFSDYKRSDQVQRGVWYGAARWVREFGLTDWASANLATARPKKLTEVDKFKAEMGIQNAM